MIPVAPLVIKGLSSVWRSVRLFVKHACMYPFARNLTTYEPFHQLPGDYKDALLYFHGRFKGDEWIAPPFEKKPKYMNIIPEGDA